MDTAKVLGRSYRPRVIDAALGRALAAAGAVVIEGARASGKTMTAMNAAASFALVDDPAVQTVIEVAPRTLLEGAAPRLLDEWQVAPELWNLVRRAVDASADPGRFILTGSAVPADDVTRHTGAGRFLRIRQRTMTWAEKLDAPTRSVSLAGLFADELPTSSLASGLDLDDVIENLLRPGFPAMTELTLAQSADRLRGYIDDVARTDIHRIADVRRDPEVIKQLILALARSTASDVSFATLAQDVRTLAPRIEANTISTYVGLLQRLFIVEAQAPWTPTLRSRARVRTSPKLHLVDPALAAAALGAGPKQLKADLSTLGLLFESAVVHDLSVLASALNGEVRHYRDSNGKEIDAVISLPDGRWGAVEVKLSGTQVPSALRSLGDVIGHIDTELVGEPAFRLVVTATGPILVADDGTITAPL
ncbi:ATP-binding protein, partial [Propionicimonas sp.]|uniref:ATP-binding protein n=1 Tax=Propionicimonas sp. TaxID=1955623 RepID=UPI0039E45028